MFFGKQIGALPRFFVPAFGVCSGFVLVGNQKFAACANAGAAPTSARTVSRVESFLLDFEADLYGRVVDVGFTSRIRGEKKFSGIDELKAEIQRDVETARSLAQDGS